MKAHVLRACLEFLSFFFGGGLCILPSNSNLLEMVKTLVFSQHPPQSAVQAQFVHQAWAPSAHLHAVIVYLVVCSQFTPPARAQLLYCQTQVTASILEEDLFWFLHQAASQLPLHLHHCLQPQTQTALHITVTTFCLPHHRQKSSLFKKSTFP